MGNPNVDKLYSTYSNITERFFDRWQQMMDAARSGDVSGDELAMVAAEAAMDSIEAVTTPWLMLFDVDAKFKPPVRAFRFVIDPGKADRTRRTRLRVDPAATLASKKLVDITNPANDISQTHVVATKSTTPPPKDRLIISLRNLTTVAPAVPAGIYVGDIVNTATTPNETIARVVVEWPG